MQELQIHRRGWLAAGLTVAIGFAALQWLWISQAPTCADNDAGHYLKQTLVLNRTWAGPEGGGVAALARAFFRTDTMRPLLIQLATLPLYALFGESYGAAMMLQVIAYLICGIVAAFLGRQLFGPVAAFFCPVAVMTLPPVLTYTREFLTEGPLSAALLLAGLVALRCTRTGRRSDYLLLGAVLGIGALIKVPFVSFVGGILLWTLWKSRSSSMRRSMGLAGGRGIARNLGERILLVAAPAVVIAGPWYLLNFHDALGHLQHAWSPWVRDLWGTGPRWSWGWFIGFWRVFLGESISLLGTLVLGLGLVWHVRRGRAERVSSRTASSAADGVPVGGVRCLLVWLLPGLIAYLLSPLRVDRHMVPFAIITLVLIGGLLGTVIWERRRVLAFVFAGGFIAQAFATSLPTPLAGGIQVAGWQAVPASKTLRKDWRARELVNVVAGHLSHLEEGDSSHCIWMIPQHGGLQSTVLSYWAYSDKRPLRFEYARETPVELAVERRLAYCDGVMFLHAPGADPNGLIGEGIYSATIRQYFGSHPDRFRPARINIDLPDQVTVALFVRDRERTTLATGAGAVGAGSGDGPDGRRDRPVTGMAWPESHRMR